MLLLLQAVEADPDDAQNWHLLGRCLSSAEQPHAAYDALAQALARDSASASAWASLAALYSAAGQTGDAAAAYRRSSQLNPLVGEVWLGLGRACEVLATVQKQQQGANSAEGGGGEGEGGGGPPPSPFFCGSY